MGRGTSIAVRHRCDPARPKSASIPVTRSVTERRGPLCRRNVLSVDAGFGDDDGPVAVQELTPIVGIAETFGRWQGRCGPLDCFAHVGVSQDRYYGGIWRRAVLLQHGIGGYECFLVA